MSYEELIELSKRLPYITESERIDVLSKNSEVVDFKSNEYCNSLTENEKWTILKNNYWLYRKFAESATEEMTKYVLAKNSMMLQFVVEPTEEQIKRAIIKNPLSFQFVKEITQGIMDIVAKYNKYYKEFYEDEIKKFCSNC